METSAKKNQRVEKDAVRFGVKVKNEFEFDFKFFSLLTSKLFLLFAYNIWYFMLKFGTFFIYFIYLTN